MDGIRGGVRFDAGVEFEIIEGGDDAALEVVNGGEEGVEGCYGGGLLEVEGGCVGVLGGLGIVIVVVDGDLISSRGHDLS